MSRRAAKVDGEIVGSKYNRWTVLDILSGSHSAKRRAICVCECGSMRTRSLDSIVSGTSRSCGCLRNEATVSRSTKHNGIGSAEYVAWKAMKQRCLDQNAQNYKYYGAKGVSVCAEWCSSFSAFLRDVGMKPSAHHSLDRINPYGDYEPGNCRWATHTEQMNNQRRHVPQISAR